MSWVSDFERDHPEEMARARAQYERAVQMPCHWGNCSVDIDPLDNKVMGGFGAMGCPCDNLPGWNSAYYEGMPRPAVPVKAKGRHGSRVQRSQVRHALPEWLTSLTA